MPNDGTSLVGGTFLVFAESGYVDICNSVIGDETWAVKNVNPFIQHHPYRPAIPNFHRKLQQQEDDE